MLREYQPPADELSSPPARSERPHQESGVLDYQLVLRPQQAHQVASSLGTSVSTFVNLRLFLSSVLMTSGQVNTCGAGC